MYEPYNQTFTCFNGRQFIVTLRKETTDFNTIYASLVEDEYGLKDFDFNDDDVVIDIGPATGGEALLISTINPKTKIYCFEPLPENIQLLKQNIVQNNLSNVSVFQKAVSGHNGTDKIYYGAEDYEISKYHHFIGNSLNIPKGNFIIVESVTLEKIFNNLNLSRIKILRMDPEGTEVDILKACPFNILKRIDWIVGEHHTVSRKDLLKLTKGLFVDIPCAWQSDNNLGHFRFKNKKL